MKISYFRMEQIWQKNVCLRVQLGLSANAIAEKIKKISSSYSEGIRE